MTTTLDKTSPATKASKNGKQPPRSPFGGPQLTAIGQFGGDGECETELLRQLDAVLDGSNFHQLDSIPAEAYAYIRESERVRLLNWQDRRLSRGLRRIALANAQSDAMRGEGA